VIPEKTTLNEKFGILADYELPEGTYPVAKYAAIGRGGHKVVTGADGSPLVDLHVHRASDAALFTHIPFILRELSNDLDDIERAKYGLRRIETYDNIQYVAYYLKRLDFDGITTDLSLVTVEDGNVTAIPYEPSASDLNPTPVEIDPTEVTTTSGQYLTATTRFTLALSAADVLEIVRACEIIYGNPLYAVISEVGLCSGKDVLSTAQNADGPVFQYVEAGAVQLNTAVCTHHPLNELNQGINLSYEVGGSESLTLPLTTSTSVLP
jgi:hypothetical protein